MRKRTDGKHLLWTLAMAFLLTLVLGTGVQAASKATVAAIGKKNYTSLEDAVRKVKNKETIVLKKNVTYSKALTISRSGKKFTIDLNKKKITFKKEALLDVKKGNVTFTNGTITHTNKAGTIFKVRKGATLNIEGGTYNGDTVNAGTMTITKGTFTSLHAKAEPGIEHKDGTVPKTALIENEGKLTIQGGTFNGKKNVTLYNLKTLNISGGTFKDSMSIPEGPNNLVIALLYQDKGESKISGGTFTGKADAVSNHGGKMSVTGGKFTAYSCVLSTSSERGTTTISGGTFDARDDITVAVSSFHGKTTIKGGTFQARDTVLDSIYGNLTISGGTFATDSDSRPIMMVYGGSITLKGGTYVGPKTWLYWRSPQPISKIKLKIDDKKIKLETLGKRMK